MENYDFDLFVIGAGSGGVRAARMSASYGAKVAVAEERHLGGTCVNVGCVPKKLFVYASHYKHTFKEAEGFGWNSGETKFQWKTLLENKNNEIKRLNEIYKNLLEKPGVTIINGRAVIKDPHTITVDGKDYTAERILVAVGNLPTVPEFEGSEHVITSNEAFFLQELPKRAIIVGGGYIAVEFAGIFNGLDVETTQLYRGELFLRGFDTESREFLADEMKKKGVNLRFQTNITKIEKTEEGLVAHLTDNTTITADLIMYATGRSPYVKGLGLEEAGVELDKAGAIVVNDLFQSSVPSIYAIGDVLNRIQLTPVALAEGMALAKHFFNNEEIKIDYDNIATTVFSQPSFGTLGLTEEEAQEKHDVSIFQSSFRPMKHTLSGSDEKMFMKMIVDKKSDRVLGIHIIGDDAGEMLQGLAIAMKAGATKADFDSTIGIHPTAAEEFVSMREPVR
ncbi:MAG: glutathione reductase (NADPH) [bacterium]|jgi:glutathione reductase (NADPH)